MRDLTKTYLTIHQLPALGLPILLLSLLLPTESGRRDAMGAAEKAR